MSKLELFVLKEDLAKTVALLHNLGLLHIEQMPLSKIMEQRGISRFNLNLEQEKAACEILLKEIDELIKGLANLVPSCIKGELKIKEDLQARSSEELREIISKKLKPQFNSLNNEICALKEEFEILPQYKEILEAFVLSKRELKVPEEMACIALIFPKRYEKDMQFFKKHLETKTKSHLEVHTVNLSPKKIVALLFYLPAIAKQIDEELFKKGTIKIELPNKFLAHPPASTLKFIENRLKIIPQELEKLDKAIFDFALNNISLLCTIKTVILNRLEEKLVLNNILQTRYTSVLGGWLPTKDLTHLTQSLESSLGKNFAIYERTQFVKNPEEVPVLLENPKATRPYELLLSLLPLPKYGTKDATGLVSLFFPIFFGLIVGDIGYGLIFLLISLFLKKSTKVLLGSVGSIFFTVSLSTIFFGILYGEFLGNFGKHYFKLPHLLFDRHESVIPFFLLSLSVGVFHIVLGFILGIIEALRKRHKKELIEKVFILGGLTGLFLLVATMVKILPSGFLPPSIVLLVVVAILLIIVRGFLGPLEAISALANILSYARLMALGLAGVMMASVANHIGGLPENIIIGVILASLLHALNLVLSVFSPTVQSLRLHYVEFFSKFYEPGGKKYNPFRKRVVEECIT